MTTMQFRPAQRKKAKLHMAIDGPAGSGKTFTALRFALALGTRVAVIDTEAGKSELYQGESPDGFAWQFDVLVLKDFSPTSYVQAISTAIGQYDVLIVDSLSHAWAGKGGALELVDQKTAASKSKNAFTSGWRNVTPMHNQLVDALLQCPMHLICTIRSKMGYVLENNIPRKVGMEPVQRNGIEYEFDVLADMNIDHGIVVSKSRCSAMADRYGEKPGPEFIGPLIHWLNEGADVPQEIIDAAGFMERIKQPEAAPEKPRKSAMEIAAEAKAKADAKAATAETPAEQPPAAKPASGKGSDLDKPCLVGDAEQIRSLFKLAGLTPEQQTKALAKRGAQVVRNLTRRQADELIATLREKIRQLNEAPQAEAVAEKTDTAAEAAPFEGSETDPCAPEQVAAIKTILDEIGDAELVKKIAAKLAEAGLSKVAELSWRDAVILHRALDCRAMEQFFEARLTRKDERHLDASQFPAGAQDEPKN